MKKALVLILTIVGLVVAPGLETASANNEGANGLPDVHVPIGIKG